MTWWAFVTREAIWRRRGVVRPTARRPGPPSSSYTAVDAEAGAANARYHQNESRDRYDLDLLSRFKPIGAM